MLRSRNTKNRAMRLTKSQKEHLLELISEGLQSDEINARASKFKPPYEVSRSQVDHYRKTRGEKIKDIEEASETDALKTGFARREERVRVLDRLAQKFEEELFDGDRLWLDQVKALGSGEWMQVIDYEEFNTAEVQQLRGVLDDIAKEMGDRKFKVEVEEEIAINVVRVPAKMSAAEWSQLVKTSEQSPSQK